MNCRYNYRNHFCLLIKRFKQHIFLHYIVYIYIFCHSFADIISSSCICPFFFLWGELASFNFYTKTYLVDILLHFNLSGFKFYPILQGANYLIQINGVSNLMNNLSTLASPNSEYISHTKYGPK